MYDDVQNGLQKVQTAVPKLRAFKRAAMIGIVLPVGDSLDTFLPTYLYIAVVSLLHDALQVFVKANYPGCNPEKMNLRTCIDFLSAKGRKKLKDPARLVAMSCDRNAYAHEPERYASWNDLDALVNAVEEELRHLGVL